VRRALAAALAAAALIAGCGGSDAPKIASKADFIAAGDSVCASLSARFESAGKANPKTAQEIADSAGVLASVYGDLHKRLVAIALPPKAGDRPGAKAYVDAVGATGPPLAALGASTKRLLAAADAKDNRKAAIAGQDVRKALDDFRAAQQQANASARGYGFNICSSLN
jgi:hypothetical protein